MSQPLHMLQTQKQQPQQTQQEQQPQQLEQIQQPQQQGQSTDPNKETKPKCCEALRNTIPFVVAILVTLLLAFGILASFDVYHVEQQISSRSFNLNNQIDNTSANHELYQFQSFWLGFPLHDVSVTGTRSHCIQILESRSTDAQPCFEYTGPAVYLYNGDKVLRMDSATEEFVTWWMKDTNRRLGLAFGIITILLSVVALAIGTHLLCKHKKEKDGEKLKDGKKTKDPK